MRTVGRHRREEEADGFRVLYVCTGNICRSPFAEMLTRHLLVGRLGGRAAAAFAVSSAGVSAVVGGQMHRDSRAELRPWGLDRAADERFVARQLEPTMVSEADLILGATPRHRSAVVERVPSALGSAFCLREFARLAMSVDPTDLPPQPAARAHALVELAQLRRGLVRPADVEDDEIPDPIGGPPEAHHHAAMLIRTSVEAIVDAIAPPA